jgi:hypothetical protein
MDAPRWRSGPFVYGSVLISLPLFLLILWALPTVLPAVIHGNFSAAKVIVGGVWGLVAIACPLAALAQRRRYQFRDDWQSPRRMSIAFAAAAYLVALASYAAIALALVKLPI